MTADDQMATMQREMAELRASLAEASAAIDELRALVPFSGPPASATPIETSSAIRDLAAPASAPGAMDGAHSDRRGFLRGAALAAGGAAAGLALSSDPAAALNGDNMKVGITTNAATGSTGLAVTGTAAAYGIGVTDNGLTSFATNAALSGHAKSAFWSGVYGQSEGDRDGVRGAALGIGTGVVGTSVRGNGVTARSDEVDGLVAVSAARNGIRAVAETDGNGVDAYSVLGSGVYGASTYRTGVAGLSESGSGGSFASSQGPGAVIEGTPSLRMVGRATAPPAQAKAFVAGSVDHGPTGTLWACVADGTPGSWRKLAGPDTAGQFHVLGSSVRIYDSRAGEAPLSVTKGVLGANQERVIDAKVGGGVPAGATAVLVNLTVVSASSGGWLAAFKNGIAWPGNSSLNWDHTGQAIANSAVVAVDTAARFKIRAAQATNVIIDAVGYYQ